MSKVLIELNQEQISKAIESLSMEDKLKISEMLEKQTMSLRWRKILKDIDSRLKKFPISKNEVIQEIQAYRKRTTYPRPAKS